MKQKKSMWMTQYNNLNMPVLFENLKCGGCVGNYWEGNEDGEKGMQPVKNEFTSTKEKFTGNLMEKLYSNKIMSNLMHDEYDDSSKKCVLSNYHLKNDVFLIERLKRRLPVLFIMN